MADFDWKYDLVARQLGDVRMAESGYFLFVL